MRSVRISKDIQADRILVSFSYEPEFVAKVKSIKGYRWHPDKKYWSFPYSEDILKNKLLSVFKNENIDVDSVLQISFKQRVKKRKAYLHHIERYTIKCCTWGSERLLE